jgi:ribosomal-protein-alanine N-acetyltransferase
LPLIKTERLLLKKYTTEDTESLFKILSDRVTMSYWPEPFTKEQTEEWINRSILSYSDFDFGRMAVILKETNKMIGDCGIVSSEIDGQPENDLGYIIHYEYWRQGFASEAAEACKQYAFEKLNLTRLCANMAFDNIASIKTAGKLNMKKEKEFYNKRNRNILTYLFSITKNYPK